MKTVGVDIRPLLEKNWGGVSWFTYHITKGLIEYAARGELRVVLFYNQRKLLHGYIVILLKRWRTHPNVFICGYILPNKILNLSMRLLNFPHIDELLAIKQYNNITILLPNLCFIALSKNTPYIAVCHDLSWETFPEFFTMRQRLWHRLINPGAFYGNAHRIISVSENTKQDLIDLYHIDPARIDVVYPGIDRTVFYPRTDTCAVLEKYNLSDNFILSVGTLEPRKNYETLLEAFDMLLNLPGTRKFLEGMSPEGTSPHLVIAGSEGWKFDRIYRFWNRMKHKSRVRFLFNVDRDDLPSLYSAARLFIYPSFYEGFGFPPLEAAACGTPVIVGHGSSLPEIMGDAAVYVDPFDIADLTRTMEKLLKDNTLFDDLKNRGVRRVQKFTWKATIEAVMSQFLK